MADALTLEFISKTTLSGDQLIYSQYPKLKKLLDRTIGVDKDLELINIKVVADSITNTLAELAAPTNKVLNFAAPQQVFIRSDAAADTAKTVAVIGQKADGSYGQFTLTSNAVDGTTAVDVGTWNFIAIAKKIDAWAGNLIIDDDGTSTTVFWTLALGATPTDGIVVVPTGYKAAIIVVSSWLIAAPGNVDSADVFELGDDFGWSLNSYEPYFDSDPKKLQHPIAASTQVLIQAYYTGTGETDTELACYLAIWED